MSKCYLYITAVLCLINITGCGGSEATSPYSGPVDITGEITDIRSKLSALSLIQTQLDQIVNSPFYDCSVSDPLIQKMCLVAQAATTEVRTELLSEIGAFSSQLQNQIDADRLDLVNHQNQIDAANASIANNSANIATNTAAIASAQASITILNSNVTTLQSQVANLQSRMTSAEAAIAALQALTASIGGTLNGVMVALSIGDELVSAGPSYESVLRRTDKTRLNGYVEAVTAYQSFGANPLTATNASNVVTVALTAHGYAVGDLIELGGLASGRGFLTGDVTGQFVVQTVTANTFTLNLARNANQSGTLGGSVGIIRKITGRGMATLWKTGDASDAAVRVTNAGSKQYNFIIRRIASNITTAELCYDKTNRSATFATINAAPEGGSGNIVCK